MNNIKIPQRSFGDISLSVAGLGTVKIGRNTGVKYPNGFSLPDDKTVQTLLNTAQSCGINWLDTAPAYGSSEERLGKLISRSDWLIASKAGEEFDGKNSYFNFNANYIMSSVERSLRRLRTDYLDILLLHSDGNDLQIIEQTDAFSALTRLKEAGKIRSFGMSCKTVAGGRAAIPLCDVLMLTLNPEYLEDLPVIYEAVATGTGVIIKKGFGSGHLIEKYGIPALCQHLFSTPITATVFGTLNSDHLRANCRAIQNAVL